MGWAVGDRNVIFMWIMEGHWGVIMSWYRMH